MHLVGKYDGIRYLGNAPFDARKTVRVRIPALAASQCAALQVDHRSEAGPIDAASYDEAVNQHFLFPHGESWPWSSRNGCRYERHDENLSISSRVIRKRRKRRFH
jgi:hypothetical protein